MVPAEHVPLRRADAIRRRAQVPQLAARHLRQVPKGDSRRAEGWFEMFLCR